ARIRRRREGGYVARRQLDRGRVVRLRRGGASAGAEPGHGGASVRGAAVAGLRGESGGGGGGAGVSGVAADAAGRAQPVLVPVQGGAGVGARGAGARHHAGVRQDVGRGSRRAAARHRERRGGVRDSAVAAGRARRGYRAGDGRAAAAAAVGGGGGDHAVQLPGDDSVVVSAVGDRLRQHVRPQALRACAAERGAAVAGVGAHGAAGRGGQSGARRRGGGGG